MQKTITRRAAIQGLGAGIAIGTIDMPNVVRAATAINVGYLHTLAVDGQLWLADHMGLFKKEGVEPNFIQFTTGLQLFQAMIGGSIDMLSTGAVISNFPARGQGKAFFMNDVEFATAQLWVNPAMGVSSFADLKGKRISTTRGTTAHVFLDRALRANGLTPDKDVEIVNQGMAEAVTSFISGAVPAVALWVPFDISVRAQLPNAKMLIDASKFYPEAAIVDGWACNADYFANNKDTLKRVIRAWVPANDFMIEKTDEALSILHDKYYDKVPLDDLKVMFKAEKVFPSKQWVKLYNDGTVTGWLQKVTDFYVSVGGIQNPVPAKEYFDPSLYVEVVGS